MSKEKRCSIEADRAVRVLRDEHCIDLVIAALGMEIGEPTLNECRREEGKLDAREWMQPWVEV